MFALETTCLLQLADAEKSNDTHPEKFILTSSCMPSWEVTRMPVIHLDLYLFGPPTLEPTPTTIHTHMLPVNSSAPLLLRLHIACDLMAGFGLRHCRKKVRERGSVSACLHSSSAALKMYQGLSIGPEAMKRMWPMAGISSL